MHSYHITTGLDLDAIINKCEELLIEKEFEKQDNFDNNINFFNLEIYFAKN
ncbi:138_t:CDS:2 [Cetraspora pellucida]|uniref:138_t:CDS:1 n=1 Tax=Cetraspora pellucida TaxID=1433469 RepID=A0ACA9JYQ4_9GLOM|nr:138_t:CDS:2 [Cetraspora pellucida]